MNKISEHNVSAIEKTVMSQIKSGKTHMRPRSYYLSLIALGVVASVLLGITVVYSVSVSSLWFRVISAAGPAYGAKRNLATLAETFPWWALVLGVISLFGLIYLIKKLGHLYKIRLIYVVILAVISFVIIGFALSYSDFPSLINSGNRINTACSVDDINCNIDSGMYGRNRLMK